MCSELVLTVFSLNYSILCNIVTVKFIKVFTSYIRINNSLKFNTFLNVLNIVFRRHIRVKMGVVEKSGCAWSDIFKNQNKLSIFIRFILKKNGFSTKKWGQSAKITDFRDFAC